MRWSSHFHTEFHVLRTTLCHQRSHHFVYGTFTLFGHVFQTCSTMIRFCNSYGGRAVPLSIASTQGITIVLFSSGYLDVSVLRVCPVQLLIHYTVLVLQTSGFPHSDIYGSLHTYCSPQHFAVSRVLHRLLVPRHPPCALCFLTLQFFCLNPKITFDFCVDLNSLI